MFRFVSEIPQAIELEIKVKIRLGVLAIEIHFGTNSTLPARHLLYSELLRNYLAVL